ncbi:exocyst complex component Sec10 [Anaeromyces robustus]|uniref:Exocyst complex component Sec10 n=1 Tax=Anaeromyces robustus TaxID=1754192 RepID=A0A1Y1VPT8_9FUNG|nr:exocyst complex component Sec10 [Anaeromyces robustus]|eukprot:ORX63320.1 exocyst complex component Sec10 [Anaeromyces robustus]
MSKFQNFGVNPKLKQLINVETFKNDYSIADFIEQITEDQVIQARKENTEFEPRQFIRTFENAIEELVKLQEQVSEDIIKLEDEVKTEEEIKKNRAKELNLAFEDVFKAFETLESRIGEVGNTAIRIGEQLENIDKQRDRTCDSKDIIQYFMEFNEGKYDRINKLVESGDEGQYNATVIVRRLINITNEVDAPGAENAKGNIEKYSEELEKKILEKFDKVYKEDDIEKMSMYAKSLMNFNSGNSCIQMYINQNKLFLLTNSQNDFVCEDTDDNISAVNPELSKLYDEIRKSCNEEWEKISQIFPNASYVMKMFIQRIFVQSIQMYIEGILKAAENVSIKLYLRNLYSSYIASKKLIEAIRDDLSEQLPNIYSYLERYLQDIFIPYLKGYLEKEKKFLTESYDKELAPFIAYHEYRKENLNKTMFTWAINSIASTASAATGQNFGTFNNNSNTPQAYANRLFGNLLEQGKVSSSNTNINSNTNGEFVTATGVVFTEESGKLDTSLCMKLLKIHSESIIRCNELSLVNELPQNIKDLFDILINYLGNIYIETALDVEIDNISAFDSKSEPNFDHLNTFKLANNFIHLLQEHFQNSILPFIETYPTVHRQIVETKNEFISKMEQKLNVILQKQINCISNWLSVLLQKQRKNDFKPKEDSIVSSSLCANTTACTSCVEFLEKTYRNMSKYLYKSTNFQSFIVEVGIIFFEMLLEHYKKYGTNNTGALILTKDIAAYRRLIEEWDIVSLAERYDMLVQLGNLFVIEPENIDSLITEGYLAKIEPYLLRPYLMIRSDWNTFSKAQKDLFMEVSETEKYKTDDLIGQFQMLKEMINEKKKNMNL